MRISSVRIQNLRGYKDQTVTLNDYTCLVGPNGAGKSTVLCALCIFFRDTEHFVTNLHNLQAEDFFCKSVNEPIKITLTFEDLSKEAQIEFKDYYRHGKLVVTAEAKYDPATKTAEVRQYGERLGMKAFRPYFAADSEGKLAQELKEKYAAIRAIYTDLPDEKTKPRMLEALRTYEAARTDLCELIPSHDQFYGFSSGVNRLQKFIQWVYVPAVKDAATEQSESKSSALRKLLARTVRSQISFADKIAEIRREAVEKYEKVIQDNQEALNQLSDSLGKRLQEYAHAGTRVQLKWQGATEQAVKIVEPMAHIEAGEGDFTGELSRFGNGLQRCYLLALLQELSVSGSTEGPKLVLGCDEPELHQHPPQARHLGEVLRRLSERNSQVIVSTHSPHLVSGERFCDVRLIRKERTVTGAEVTFATHEMVAETIGQLKQDPDMAPEAAALKLHQSLLPSLNELFFARVVVLVEGPEDAAYIETYLELGEYTTTFRRLGCHIIAVERKSRLLEPLVVAKHFRIPTFVVFDADAHATKSEHRRQHQQDNERLLRLRGYDAEEAMPSASLWKYDTVMWHSEISQVVQQDFGANYSPVLDKVRLQFGQEKDIGKLTLFVREAVRAAWDSGLRSENLDRLCKGIITFAENPWKR